ncbi:MAG: FecR domain-containing protein, partial [Proteiniphilum sp.]
MEKSRRNMDEAVRFVARHYREGVFEPSNGWRRVTASLPGFGVVRKARRASLVTRMAAAVLLLLVAVVGVWITVNRSQQLLADADNTRFTLPDQTGIVMQKGATLEYNRHFGKTGRYVSMRGEITFTVARDDAKPFIVSTPSARVEVLGTEFTVITGDNETRLIVESGTVRFTPNDPVIPLLCSAGMVVHYSAADETVKVTSPDSEMEINGIRRSLTFNNMKLKEVIPVLSHFYNVPIELPEADAELPFTSSFTGESIIQVINIINLTLDTRVTITD